MAQQRLSLWNAEEDIEGDVDLSIAMGNYDQTVQYEECTWNLESLSSSI